MAFSVLDWLTVSITSGIQFELASSLSQTGASTSDVLFNSTVDFLFGRAQADVPPSDIEQIREKIAATAESFLGSTAFALDARFENFPPGEWKCNCFVSHVLTLSGLNPPRYEGDVWPVRAGDWANAKFTIPGWQIVNTPIRGDVAAFGRAGGESGHVGIVVGNSTFGRNVVGAGRETVEYSRTHRLVRFGFGWTTRASTPVVYRRYIGSGN